MARIAELIDFVCDRFGVPGAVREHVHKASSAFPNSDQDLTPKREEEVVTFFAQLVPRIAVTKSGSVVYESGPPAAPKAGFTREYLMELGAFWWPLTFGNGYTMDTLETMSVMGRAILNMLAAVGAKRAHEALQNEPTFQEFVLGSTLWAHNAFPVVQLGGHKYAAALMATQVPAGIDIRAPWPSFVMELPNNFLFTADPDTGRDIAIEFIQVSVVEDKWTFLSHARHVNLHRSKWTLNEMLVDPTERAFPESSELDSRDPRTLILMTRLVLNTCLAMSDPSNVKQVGKHGKASESLGRAPMPVARTFKVGKAIELDVRPALYDYLNGIRRTSPTVQFLVRGHWRNQACGPQHSMHRVKWIEPYWKGPEEAVITVRPHVVGSRE